MGSTQAFSADTYGIASYERLITEGAATNGSYNAEEVDGADETALSPPPSSMADSASPDVLGDEIV